MTSQKGEARLICPLHQFLLQVHELLLQLLCSSSSISFFSSCSHTAVEDEAVIRPTGSLDAPA